MVNHGTVFVVAEFRAKKGQEDALRAVLTALVPPTRREPSCIQYDLLEEPANPASLLLFERWENEESLERHLQSAHVQTAHKDYGALVDGEPVIRRLRKM